MEKCSLPLYRTVGPSYLALLRNSGWPNNTYTLNGFGDLHFHSYYNMASMTYLVEKKNERIILDVGLSIVLIVPLSALSIGNLEKRLYQPGSPDSTRRPAHLNS